MNNESGFFSRDANRLTEMFQDSERYCYFIENEQQKWLKVSEIEEWTNDPSQAVQLRNYYKAFTHASGLNLSVKWTITEHEFIAPEEEDDFLTNPKKQLESLLRRTWIKAGGSYRDPAMNEWIKSNEFLFSSIIKP